MKSIHGNQINYYDLRLFFQNFNPSKFPAIWYYDQTKVTCKSS